jgi:hypothetical protein
MSTLTADRRRAIEQSGWGEEFHLVQPHNLAFWAYCLLIAAGVFVISGQLSIAAAAYSGALTSGIIAFGLLAVAYLWFIHYEDRYTTVPRKLAAAGFVWGGVANDHRADARIDPVALDVHRHLRRRSDLVHRAPRRAGTQGLGAGLMLTAMVMHGLWDASAAIAGDDVISIVPGIVAFVLISVFVWVYENSEGIERKWMRELMAPEVDRGVVTRAELDALAGTRSTLKTYIRCQPSRRGAKAETDLAHRIARDDGADTDAVQRARVAVAQARIT